MFGVFGKGCAPMELGRGWRKVLYLYLGHRKGTLRVGLKTLKIKHSLFGKVWEPQPHIVIVRTVGLT